MATSKADVATTNSTNLSLIDSTTLKWKLLKNSDKKNF